MPTQRQVARKDQNRGESIQVYLRDFEEATEIKVSPFLITGNNQKDKSLPTTDEEEKKEEPMSNTYSYDYQPGAATSQCNDYQSPADTPSLN